MAKLKPFSKLSKTEKLKHALEMFDDAVSADNSWQVEAEEDFAFAAGEQWTKEEKRILSNENRPSMVWNYIKSVLDLIMGVIEQNRVRVVPQPVEPSDQVLCDVIESVSDVIDDQTNAETEQDEAFFDSITCGRGYVALDVSLDPKRPGEPKVSISSVPVHEIRLDPAGVKDDLSDHRYIFREKWYSKEDFQVNYPDHAKDIEDLLTTGDPLILDETGSTSDSVFDTLDEDRDDAEYDFPLDADFYSRKKNRIRVVHMEYWEGFQRYYAMNPTTGQIEEFQKGDLKGLKINIPNFEYKAIWDKKVRWVHFCKDKILFEEDSPIPHDGFSIVPMFAYKDKSKRMVQHYGVVRLLKDPQREVNKRWSQALNLMVNQGQGVMAETDAFVDVDQAEDSWNDPRRITWMQKGAIQQGKVTEKPGVTFPDASVRMEELAQEAMKRISGVNPDLLGMDRGRQEAGVVIRLRQQQGLTLLAKLFRNYKEMQKQLFLLKAAVIMNFMTDAQIQRIIGENDKYLIQTAPDPENEGQTITVIIDREAMMARQKAMQQQQMQMMQQQQMQQASSQQQGPQNPQQPQGPPQGTPQPQGPPQPGQPPQGPQQGPTQPGMRGPMGGQPQPPPVQIPEVPQIPLRDIKNLEYNIKVEDAPGNMTKEMLELSTLMEMKQRGFAVDDKMVIEKMDLSAKQKTRWLAFIDQQQQSQQQQQQQAMQAQMQIEMAKIQIEQAKVQMQGQAQMGRLQMDGQQSQMDMQLDQAKLQLQGQKTMADIQNAQQKNALTQQRITGDQQISEGKAQMDAQRVQIDGQKAMIDGKRVELDAQKISADVQRAKGEMKLKLAELSQDKRMELAKLTQAERESVREASIAMAQLDMDEQKMVMDLAAKMKEKTEVKEMSEA